MGVDIYLGPQGDAQCTRLLEIDHDLQVPHHDLKMLCGWTDAEPVSTARVPLVHKWAEHRRAGFPQPLRDSPQLSFLNLQARLPLFFLTLHEFSSKS